MAQDQIRTVSAPPTDTQPGAPVEGHGFLEGVAAALRRHPWWALALALVVGAILVLAYGGYFLGWEWTGFEGNTFWDWLSLLITPVTIAAVSLAFSIQQGRASVEAGERQRQDAMLEAYFDHITHLLVEEGLLAAPQESPVRAVARARTIATLQRASQPHRAAILRFLDESGLMACDPPVFDPHAAELEGGARPRIA